jgi:hypothetical protein
MNLLSVMTPKTDAGFPGRARREVPQASHSNHGAMARGALTDDRGVWQVDESAVDRSEQLDRTVRV